MRSGRAGAASESKTERNSDPRSKRARRASDDVCQDPRPDSGKCFTDVPGFIQNVWWLSFWSNPPGDVC